jgi:hypothetical protein
MGIDIWDVIASQDKAKPRLPVLFPERWRRRALHLFIDPNYLAYNRAELDRPSDEPRSTVRPLAGSVEQPFGKRSTRRIHHRVILLESLT